LTVLLLPCFGCAPQLLQLGVPADQVITGDC